MKPQTVGIYCASSSRTLRRYVDTASQLGTALAQAGVTIYYGGGAAGLMGALADGALAAGGQVVGVRPTFISKFERDHQGVSEMIVTETMHQRKQVFFDRCDAFVALPGAIGTLDELIETITRKRLGLHAHPICILNVDGFFAPLLQQFQRLVDQHLVARRFLSLFGCASDVPAAMEYLQNHGPAAAQAVMWDDD
ncbi:MAG: LOG family protein [Planctomycetota bacterium]